MGFKTYGIPLLEYCSQVWNPQNESDVRRIESVKRAFTERLTGYNGLNYPARLKKAGLCSLKLRRSHADLCLCYNLLHGNIETDIRNFFEIGAPSISRGHKWKLKNPTPCIRLNFFCHSINQCWNALQPDTVE